MRNFIVLGASALVLALGVAQASASQNNSVADFRAEASAQSAEASAQPAYTGELRDVRGQSVDPYAWQGNDFPALSANARSAGH
jgi:hypothetical protein